MTKKDFTQVAHGVFQQAVGEAPIKAETAKQTSGRKGGIKGGKARMDALNEEQRRELAMRGVQARKGAPGPQPGAQSSKKSG